MRLAVIQVGDVEASTREIRNKKKEFEFEWYIFDEDISTEDLIFEIKALLPHVDRLMVVF